MVTESNRMPRHLLRPYAVSGRDARASPTAWVALSRVYAVDNTDKTTETR